MSSELILEVRSYAGAVSVVMWNIVAACCFSVLWGVVTCRQVKREMIVGWFCACAAVFFIFLTYLSACHFYRMELNGNNVRLIGLAKQQTVTCAKLQAVELLRTYKRSCSLRVRVALQHLAEAEDYFSFESSNQAVCEKLDVAARSRLLCNEAIGLIE
jgi:hypothetical protein